MSRSPRMNQSTPPSSATTAIASRVSPGDAPALLGMDAPRERVEQRVEVGRDRETPVLEVVADVADDRDVARPAGSASRPRVKRAPPTPPASTVTRGMRRAASPRSLGRVDVALDAGQAQPRPAVALRAARARSSAGTRSAGTRRSRSSSRRRAATSASGRACAIELAHVVGRDVRAGRRRARRRRSPSRAARARARRWPRDRARRRRARRRRARAPRRARRRPARRRRPRDRPRGTPPTTRRSRNSTRSARASPSSTSARRDLPRGSAFTGTRASHPPWERATIGPSLCRLPPHLPPLRLGYKASAEQFAPAELLSFGRRRRAPRPRQRRHLGSLPAVPARRRALPGVAAVARRAGRARPRACSSARAC